MSESNHNKSNQTYQGLSQIEKKVVEANPEVFKDVPNNKRHQIIKAVLSVKQTSHSGPIPDPDTLAKYNEIIPNGAERIMTMAENQASHRIAMEKKVIRGQLNQSNIGQFLAFFIGVIALSVAGYCILEGHDTGGTIIGAGGLTSLVTAFIKGKNAQRKNLEDKN